MDPEIRKRLDVSLTVEFVEQLQSDLQWAGQRAWCDAFDPVGLAGPVRCSSDVDLALDRIRRSRRLLGCEALKRTTDRLGIPCHERRPGGHAVVIAELGETLVIVEPGKYVGDRPAQAAYKIDLALRGLGTAREPYLPFEPPLLDVLVSGGMLVVFQHIVPLSSEAPEDHELTDLRLIVPDEALQTALVDLSVKDDGFEVHFGSGMDEPAPIVDAAPRLRPVPRRRTQERDKDQGRGGGENA